VLQGQKLVPPSSSGLLGCWQGAACLSTASGECRQLGRRGLGMLGSRPEGEDALLIFLPVLLCTFASIHNQALLSVKDVRYLLFFTLSSEIPFNLNQVKL